MTQINAYIGFNGKCREAMTFYKECLGGELTLQTIAETPVANQCPEGMQDQIMHSALSKNGLLLMGSDMVSEEGYIQGNNVALALNCSSDEEISTFFTKLSEGGKVMQAPRTEFWGGIFAALTDKFGIRWMLNYEKNRQ